MMLSFYYNYAVLMAFLITSAGVSLLLVSLTESFARRIRYLKKLMAYECGFNPFSSARIMFDVHFFIVALLFLVFDLEILYLYPWSLGFRYLSDSGVFGAYVFIFILIVGYVYEWKTGSLNWTWRN